MLEQAGRDPFNETDAELDALAGQDKADEIDMPVDTAVRRREPAGRL
jgi:hypothetical protein